VDCDIRGGYLDPGEVIRHARSPSSREQLGIAPEALADYAARGGPRYEQLDALRDGDWLSALLRPVRVELRRGSCRLR
jgi:hypothetical protein